ncbi:cupin domain-containing protein [Sphingopyxis sp. KK2]|uniref:cupin domain-containing protein n=1 Tax=Sphingopyxis sp. KK2 TaxID=1855727 RepID=UPI00097E61BF|nr:cupin domain-containing protein [Sphingopyxis sp. KK2]
MADQDQGTMTGGEAAVPSFAALVAPLSVEEFVARYWNREFRAWPGRAGRFAALIGWDEINHILATQRIEPPRLQLVKTGKTVAADNFIDMSGPNRRIDAGAVTAQLAQGATMVLSFVDEMVPRIGALADRMVEALGARCNVNLYAGWRADHGFDLHWDHHDVIILQVAGRKHWRVERPTRDHPARGEIVPPPGADDVPVFDAIVEEGAILYIPRGWWHVATPVEEPSLHLTIALSPPTGQDYLRWLVDKAVAEPLFRRDWPAANGAEASAGFWRELGDAMAALHAAHPPEAFLAEQRAERSARPVFTLPHFAAGKMARIGGGSRLRPASKRGFAAVHDAVSGDHGIEAGGRLFPCSTAVGAAVGRLSSDRDVPFDALAMGLDDGARRELEQLLIRLNAAGFLFVDLGR